MNTIHRKINNFFSSYPAHTFQNGHILIHAGDNPPGAIYLESGQIRQYDIANSGQEIVTHVFKPSSVLPVSWILNKIPNQYFFEAFSGIKIRIVPEEAFVEFLQENSDITLYLMRQTLDMTDDMQRRMVLLMGGSTKHRVLFELAIECRRYGIRQPDGSCILEMHEDELAARSGLARETISRHLTKIKDSHHISITHKQIHIKDPQLLEKELGELTA